MTLRRQLLALSLTALGCESIAPRTTPDASGDAGATVDAPDVLTSDIVDASPDTPEVTAADVIDVQIADTFDVPQGDIVDAVVADAPDVPATDIIDASIVDSPDVPTEDSVDATSADAHDVVTPDIVDASVAATPDVVTTDTVDASVNPFPSTGEDGPFPGTRVPNGAGIIELAPRVWNFTTILIARGVTVRATPGNATMELRASGDVVINGIIDLSGGPGGEAFYPPVNSTSRSRAGIGGDTGIPHDPRTFTIQVGLPVPPAAGGSGEPGQNGSCGYASGGRFGGGAGGYYEGTCHAATGAGGGGYAGGGGGAGGFGASHGLDLGGLGGEGGGASLARGTLAMYAGGNAPTLPSCGFPGGGGSIGETAARDLAVRMTFRPGSGGGGGGPTPWGSWNPRPGGGGGGGGGAVRIASRTSITLNPGSSIRVRGGPGGRGTLSGVPSTFPMAGGFDMPSGSGGGGSGGVVYLSAPRMDLHGTMDARGGAGGANRQTECASVTGGAGGLGRVRLSVDPSQCSPPDTSFPPVGTGCAPSPDGGAPGQAYVGVWPN